MNLLLFPCCPDHLAKEIKNSNDFHEPKIPKQKKYVAAVYMRARVSEELANHLIT